MDKDKLVELERLEREIDEATKAYDAAAARLRWANHQYDEALGLREQAALRSHAQPK